MSLWFIIDILRKYGIEECCLLYRTFKLREIMKPLFPCTFGKARMRMISSFKRRLPCEIFFQVKIDFDRLRDYMETSHWRSSALPHVFKGGHIVFREILSDTLLLGTLRCTHIHNKIITITDQKLHICFLPGISSTTELPSYRPIFFVTWKICDICKYLKNDGIDLTKARQRLEGNARFM